MAPAISAIRESIFALRQTRPFFRARILLYFQWLTRSTQVIGQEMSKIDFRQTSQGV
jgi:hypothetical protein